MEAKMAKQKFSDCLRISSWGALGEGAEILQCSASHYSVPEFERENLYVMEKGFD